MIEIEIPKNNWLEYVDWCSDTFKNDNDFPILRDGKKLKLLFSNSKQRVLFALRFGI